MKQSIHSVLAAILLMGCTQMPNDEQELQRIYEEVKTPYKYGVVVRPDENSEMVDSPTVFRQGDRWLMTYIQYDGRGYETWLAESNDLLEWHTLGKILSFADAGWDKDQRGGYPALQDYEWGGSYALKPHEGQYWMSYLGSATPGYEGLPISIGMASTSDDPSIAHEWETYDSPILSYDDPAIKAWESRSPYKSTVYQADFQGHPFVLFYNAAEQVGEQDVREKIGIAYSDNMKQWTRYAGNPVMAHDTKGTITGDAQLTRMGDWWVMFFYSAFDPAYPYTTYDSFAISRDLVNWKEWKGERLIYPSEPYDALYAHKPFVMKYNGIVYHYYCAVDKNGYRTIALATSKEIGTKKTKTEKQEQN